MAGSWIEKTPGQLKAWRESSCKHEKLRMFKNSIADTRTCEECHQRLSLVIVYGVVPDGYERVGE